MKKDQGSVSEGFQNLDYKPNLRVDKLWNVRVWQTQSFQFQTATSELV